MTREHHLPYVLDCAETLPDPFQSMNPSGECLVTIFGLHLSRNEENDGALLLFNPDVASSMVLFEKIHHLRSDDVDQAGAVEQLDRLIGEDGIAQRQQDVLNSIRAGIEHAAGLNVVDPVPNALSPGIALKIPDETDPMTFATYARAEQTPFISLLEYTPPSYRFMRQGKRKWDTAALDRLRQNALVPCGPDFSDEEIAHAVLGPVKAAEYAGVRWIANPERATWYADVLEQKYGPGHDAYRPVFDTSSPSHPVDQESGHESARRVTISRTELQLDERKAKR